MCCLLFLYILFFMNFGNSVNDEEMDTIYKNIFEPSHENNKFNSTTIAEPPLFSQLRSITNNKVLANKNANDNIDEEESTSFNDTLTTTVPWNIFIAMLMQESFDQLLVIKDNIHMIYHLSETEKQTVMKVFNNSDEDFEHLILKRYKNIMKSKAKHTDKEFMLNFVDVAMSILEKIVSFNLSLVKGMLDSPTTWFHQKLRDKISRQQSKNSTHYIRYRVCKVLSICKEKTKYSEYVVEWTRHIFALYKDELTEFFEVAAKVLNANSHFIRSNVKFRQTLKYITLSPEIVQRDTLDFLDEVVETRQDIYNMVPRALKHGAWALTQLFNLIDDYYDLNGDNIIVLEDISDILSVWRYQEINVFYVLESIVNNMNVNIAQWPKKVKDDVESFWYQITVL